MQLVVIVKFSPNLVYIIYLSDFAKKNPSSPPPPPKKK